MRTEELKYFIEIYKSGSINKAAQNLNISQQGLSHCIKSLESQTGSKLFQRSSKGVSLTAFGQGFLEKAENVINATEELREYVDKNKAEKLTRIKVGLRISLNSSPMSSAIYNTVEDFGLLNSDIKIVTHFAVQNVLLDELLSGDLDAAYVIGPVDEDIFNVFPVLRYKLVVIASTDMGLENQKSLNIKDLDGVPLIVPSITNPLYTMIEQLFVNAKANPKLIKAESSAKTMAHLVSRGEGAGFMPQNSAEVVCRMYPKVRMHPVEPITFFYYSIVTLKGKPSPSMQRFINYITENTETNIIPDAI